MLIVKVCLATTVPSFGGKVNLEEGMLLTSGIEPIGTGLQEPVLICSPTRLVNNGRGRVGEELYTICNRKGGHGGAEVDKIIRGRE